MAYEEPAYEVVQTFAEFEIRQYAPFIVAETTVAGGFDGTGATAFRRLAGYIFGQNSAAAGTSPEPDSSLKMNMTIPVTYHEAGSDVPSASGPRAAPVHRQQPPAQSFTYRFVMERKYDRASLPVPNDHRVHLRELPVRTVAALRYSGRTTEDNFSTHLAKLRELLLREGFVEVDAPQAAVYNSPFTLPFMRRNEVLVEVARVGSGARSTAATR